MSVNIRHKENKVTHYHMLKNQCRHKKKRSNEECNQNCTPNADTSIHKLNNDCLMLIFFYLPIIDRIRIEGGMFNFIV